MLYKCKWLYLFNDNLMKKGYSNITTNTTFSFNELKYNNIHWYAYEIN